MRLEIHYGGYDIHVEDANVDFSVSVLGEAEEIRLLANPVEYASADLPGVVGAVSDVLGF